MKANDEEGFNLIHSRLNFINCLAMFVHMHGIIFVSYSVVSRKVYVSLKYLILSLGWSVPDAVLGLNALVTHEAIIITWIVSSHKYMFTFITQITLRELAFLSVSPSFLNTSHDSI